jgi:hypothetical protein
MRSDVYSPAEICVEIHNLLGYTCGCILVVVVDRVSCGRAHKVVLTLHDTTCLLEHLEVNINDILFKKSTFS